MDNQSVRTIDLLPPVKASLDGGLRISLLGGFRIYQGGEFFGPERFRLHKACSLIKLLALAPRHRLQRDQILEWLWPDGDPEASANSLHQVLRSARQVLEAMQPPCYIHFEDEFLCLHSNPPLWVDVEAFEAAAAWAAQRQDPSLCQAALELYAGELLPEDRYEDWAIQKREALQQTYLKLLQDLAHLHEARGEHQSAISAYQRLIALDSLLEDAHAGLMRLYALSGQRSQALRQYQILQEILDKELEAEPDPGTKRLHQQILAGSYPPPESQIRFDEFPALRREVPRHNLPLQLTSFIGREKEMMEVQALLSKSPGRLVTLTGSGGVGKTRLSLMVASHLLAEFDHGVWLVELAPLSDPTLISSTVATLFGLSREADRPLQDTLNEYFCSKRLLLILDNCEHLIQEAAQFAEAVLHAAAEVQILATSRESLGLAGETAYLVPSLQTPELLHLPPIQSLAQFDAVRLFIERASTALPAFTLTEANAPAVAQICRRLDGIPLAIELAAARVKVLSAEHIATRLDDRFRLLTGGSRTAFPRHQTLHALIDWSYGLLSEPERILFRCLSAFRGGWRLEAAEALCPCGEKEGFIVLDVLAGLVNKSLVSVEMKGGEVHRYQMLETIRQYAQEKLLDNGETELLRNLHLEYFATFAEAMEKKLHSPAYLEAFEELDEEFGNHRLALDWAFGGGRYNTPGGSRSSSQNAEVMLGLRLVTALADHWRFRSLYQEELDWLSKGLAFPVEEESLVTLRAKVYLHANYFEVSSDSADRQYLIESLDMHRKNDDKVSLARTLIYFGGMLSDTTPHRLFPVDFATGIALLEKGIGLLEEIGGPWELGYAYHGKAIIATRQKDNGTAQKLYEKSIPCFEQAGDILSINEHAKPFLAFYASEQGDYQTARRLYDECLEFHRQVNNKDLSGLMIASLGTIAYFLEDFSGAEAYFQEAFELFSELGPSVWASRYLGYSVACQGQRERARQIFLKSQSLGRKIHFGDQLGDPYGDLAFVLWMGSIAEGLGQPALAARFLGAVEAVLETFFKPLDEPDKREYDRITGKVRSALDEAAFTAAWAEGRKLALEQALEEALIFCQNAG